MANFNNAKTAVTFAPPTNQLWHGGRGMGDLASQPGMKPGLPALEVQSLNHWTTREVPVLCSFMEVQFIYLHIIPYNYGGIPYTSIYHKIHLCKVYSSVVFSMFTVLQASPLSGRFEIVPLPQKEMLYPFTAISHYLPFCLTCHRPPLIYFLSPQICLGWTLCINAIILYVRLL